MSAWRFVAGISDICGQEGSCIFTSLEIMVVSGDGNVAGDSG